MQGAIARVCMVVTAAILNHPLLFPHENTTLPEQDEDLVTRMREHEERLEIEKARLEKELAQLDSKLEEAPTDEGFTWYFWSAVSFVIFIAIEMCSVDLAEDDIRPVEDEDVISETGSAPPWMMDKKVLRNFCDKCTYTSSHENWRVREFVEGFADDLLESLRSMCDREVDMEVGDFIGIGSMFESWKVCKPLMCDLLVPFSPPDPHSFQYHLWCSPSSDIPPDMQGCGTVKVTMFGEEEEEKGCLCGSANLGDDMLCLLHNKNKVVKVNRSPDDLLCSRSTHFLAKDQVMRWFQISVTKAWGHISHKYDFEVTFRNLDSAGALKIRFRSGKVVLLNLIPVIQLKDTDAYFILHFPLDRNGFPDPYWSLSLAVYERNLLKYFAKRLPQNSCHLHCLQVATFLHRKQSSLTGKSALTSYHFKTAVVHLLLSTKTTAWGAASLEQRLQDVFSFLQRSLREKRLYHALIGNSRVPEDIQVPERFRKTEPVNLFRSLVLQRELYAATVRYFQELLRNAPVLIEEYTPHLPNGSLHHTLEDGL